MRGPMEEYLQARFEVSPGGCWEWTRSVGSHGYGQGWNGRTVVSAHRCAYETWVGPIPPGLCVLHRCDNRRCIRPDHLFVGTKRDNSIDMARKGRGRPNGKADYVLRKAG